LTETADIAAPRLGLVKLGGNPSTVWGTVVVVFRREDRIDGELREGGGDIKRFSIAGIFLLYTVVLYGVVTRAIAGAASKAAAKLYEGQIKSIKIDKCGL
jgi:hypothetical protein